MQLIREYVMATDGIQAPGAIVLINKGTDESPDYVTWFRNDQDSEREGRPCYYTGHYHGDDLREAESDFWERTKRYDPTGQLHRERADA